MATLLKIRGLDRDVASGESVPPRGFRVASQYKQAQGGSGTAKATLTPTANSVKFDAKYAGAWGNNVRVATASGSLAVAVSYAASTGHPTITVTAPATATLAANQAIVAAVNADPIASQFVTASVAGTGAAANAAVAAANLATGSDGTGASLYPIYIRVSGQQVQIIDIDNQETARNLRRNNGRFVSLGQP